MKIAANIPEGFSSVTPYFFSDDAEKFIAFLAAAFDGEEVLRSLSPDGEIANVQVRLGTSTIMISTASEGFPATRAAYYIYVDDADKVQVTAIAAGATQVMAVADMPYGDRQGGVQDPFGNIWWVSQRLTKAPYC